MKTIRKKPVVKKKHPESASYQIGESRSNRRDEIAVTIVFLRYCWIVSSTFDDIFVYRMFLSIPNL